MIARKHPAVAGILFAVLAMFASPVMANEINSATVTDNCTGYQIILAASSLVVGNTYTIFWAINIDGVEAVKNDFFEFTATASTKTETLNRTWAQYGITLTGSVTFTGQAVLVDVTHNVVRNTVQMKFSQSKLSCPACLVRQLGSAGAFSILGLPDANIQLSSGPLQVNANVGIGTNGQIHLSGGATLRSTLFADPSARVQIDNGSSFGGGVIVQSMTTIENAALAEATAVGSLSPTQTFSQIQSAVTINGNRGRNVIQVDGPLHLSSGQNLTLSGGPNDTFILTIIGGFQLDGGASVVLNGVSPNQVLFYFPGSGDQIQTSGNADTNGIFLAPMRTIQINGGVHVSEFISGSAMSFQSNPVVNQLPACVSQ